MFLTLDDALEALALQLDAVQDTAEAASRDDESLRGQMYDLCQLCKDVHLLAIGERRPDSPDVKRAVELIKQSVLVAEGLKPLYAGNDQYLSFLQEFIDHCGMRQMSLEEALRERLAQREMLACAAF